MTDKQTYQLQDGINRVHRSGLVLEAGQTIESYPDILRDHGDVLEAVDEPDEPEEEESEDDE